MRFVKNAIHRIARAWRRFVVRRAQERRRAAEVPFAVRRADAISAWKVIRDATIMF
jgi:hypothetical protein